MLKIPKEVSITLSLFLTVFFFAALVLLAFFMPSFATCIVNATESVETGAFIFSISHGMLIALGYAIITLMMTAIMLMVRLLLRVKAGKVFTDRSVSLIRAVSWCCIFIGVLFAVIGCYLVLAFLVACAALFLGLCLRVVKNVVEEATEIKNENDLTV